MNEFRKEKKELEEKILKLINEFEGNNNCYIHEIDLIHTGGRLVNGDLKAKTVKVNVDFKLCD